MNAAETGATWTAASSKINGGGFGSGSTAHVPTTAWVASPTPTRNRVLMRSTGGLARSVGPSSARKGGEAGPNDREEVASAKVMSKLDVGTYRETAAYQRLVKVGRSAPSFSFFAIFVFHFVASFSFVDMFQQGTKELRYAAGNLKAFFLAHDEESKNCNEGERRESPKSRSEKR